MSGSLNHIINDDGSFRMDLIENLRDAREALEECFTIIYELSGRDSKKVSEICKKHCYPDPWIELSIGGYQSTKKPMRINSE
jgi:hypothetical protein